AAVITEAAAGNMGVVAPRDGFNQALARIAHEYGALLIVDEVMTGFRASAGGWHALDPVDADLWTFGKVMGGGLPAAAFGGRADLMDQLAPDGPVYQAGTLSGNPLACAAGLATLRLADEAAYRRLEATAATVQELASRALTAAGVPHRVSTAGTLFSIFFTDVDVRDYDGARTQDTAAFAACFHTALAHGVHLPPSPYEAWFVSTAVDDAAVEQIAAALPATAAAAAAASSAAAGEASCLRSSTAHAAARCPTRPASCTGACRTSTAPSWACRWPRPWRRPCPGATSSTWCPARWSAPGRPPSRWPGGSGCRSTSTSGSSRVRTGSRARASG